MPAGVVGEDARPAPAKLDEIGSTEARLPARPCRVTTPGQPPAGMTPSGGYTVVAIGTPSSIASVPSSFENADAGEAAASAASGDDRRRRSTQGR